MKPLTNHIRHGVRRSQSVLKLAGARDVVGAGGSGEQAVVADTVEALGQDVDQETADELIGGERHPLVSGVAVGAINLKVK